MCFGVAQSEAENGTLKQNKVLVTVQFPDQENCTVEAAESNKDRDTEVIKRLWQLEHRLAMYVVSPD